MRDLPWQDSNRQALDAYFDIGALRDLPQIDQDICRSHDEPRRYHVWMCELPYQAEKPSLYQCAVRELPQTGRELEPLMTSNTDQIDRVRKMGSARIIGSAACVLAAVSMASLVPAQAEPVTDRILAGSQIITRDGCILLKVNFNIRIRYVSHFPLNRGDELRIVVRPIDPAQAAAELLTARESARPPANRAIPIKAIDFEAGRGEGSTLRLQFNGPVDYQVGPGADFESVVIALADPKSRKACAPVVPLGASGTWNTTVVPESAQPGLGSRASAATLPSRARSGNRPHRRRRPESGRRCHG